MPFSIIIASTVQDHARLNALWPLETPVLIVDSPSAAATLAATRDLFRPPIARHRSRYGSAGSQQESSTAGQHGASHVPVDLQNEVVELFLHGAVSGEIAARLRLSEDAVARHILAVLHRLGARNRGELRSIIVAQARRAATPETKKPRQ